EAAREAGTEVTGARAPWALLKHRRRRRLPVATEAAEAPAEPAPSPEAPASEAPAN
ncbi:SGNH/GDSL hydrolase family protein, partial [Streptomyces sp. SID2131]|nr:SGNH/GDSL hydrolase family protein [Streptomyces sp. SID2131]